MPTRVSCLKISQAAGVQERAFSSIFLAPGASGMKMTITAVIVATATAEAERCWVLPKCQTLCMHYLFSHSNANTELFYSHLQMKDLRIRARR